MTNNPHTKKHLDVRGLPPPEPMVQILEAVAYLRPGETLTVSLDRIPHPLYPRLAERGLHVTTEMQADAVVQLSIKRP